jgi:pimeloyl-ACP methyl ester carboxylesterase
LLYVAWMEVGDALGIERFPVIAASAGGHAALRYALAAPERVTGLALLGPMGITSLGLRAAVKMMMVSMFPGDAQVGRTSRWAIGEAPAVDDGYGEWFATVLRSVASPPRVGRPVALKPDEMRRIDQPVLLVLGTNDHLVGDANRAASRAGAFPNLRIELLSGGHLIGVERAAEMNAVLGVFLDELRTE